MSKVYLGLDVFSIFDQCFYSLGGNKNMDEVLKMFCNHISKFWLDHPSDDVVAFWEGSGKYFDEKTNLYSPEYQFPKSTVINQGDIFKCLQLIKLLLTRKGFINIRKTGFESLQLLDSFCDHLEPDDHFVYVTSNFKSYQFIREDVSVNNFSSNKFYDMKTFISEFLVHPKNYLLSLSIAGDSSKGIPSVPNITSFYKVLKSFPILSNNLKLDLKDLLEYIGTRPKRDRASKAYKSFEASCRLIRKNYETLSVDYKFSELLTMSQFLKKGLLI